MIKETLPTSQAFSPGGLVVVLNWAEELKRLAPAK